MKPKPFCGLNYLTVPTAMTCSLTVMIKRLGAQMSLMFPYGVVVRDAVSPSQDISIWRR
jgi:hypothetical protein